ncbi:MAG: AraC family transcriptional regulator [Paenibacillaceae bacterium]|nr:AraC family transcriptional regulator [Paenibacillaceae bacterium]
MSFDIRDEQIKLLWTARVDYAAHSEVESHAHNDFCQLIVVLEGEGHLQTDGARYVMKPGDCYLFYEGVSHGLAFEQKSITLDYKFVVFCEPLKRLFSGLPCRLGYNADQLAALKRCFRLSHQHKRSPEALLPLQIDALFKTTLLDLQLRQKKQTSGDSAVFTDRHEPFEMADYLREHYSEAISLVQLAETFRFHPHYVIDLFRKHTGATPNQYLQQVRLEKARELLEFTKLPVTEIAGKVGWSLPYFSRLFHAKEGMSALAYRENVCSAVGEDLTLDRHFENKWRIVSSR